MVDGCKCDDITADSCPIHSWFGSGTDDYGSGDPELADEIEADVLSQWEAEGGTYDNE